MRQLLAAAANVAATLLHQLGLDHRKLTFQYQGRQEKATTVFGDVVNTGEWIGFTLIWIALAIFSVDAIRRSRQPSRVDALEVTEPT